MTPEEYDDTVRARLVEVHAFDDAHMAALKAEIDLVVAVAHHAGHDWRKLADSIARKYRRGLK